MKKKYLEAGVIVNTHGIRGELRIQPWADSPAFLANIDTFYIDDKPVKVITSKIHKSFLLVTLEGVSDIESAIRQKNKIVYISRDEITLEDDRHFVVDLIGLKAIDTETNEEFGVVSEVLSLPSNNVYVIKNEQDNNTKKETLIPAVADFVKEINIDAGYIKFRLIEGM